MTLQRLHTGQPPEARQPRYGQSVGNGPWLTFEKYKMSQEWQPADEVATTMASLTAKNLPWWPCYTEYNEKLRLFKFLPYYQLGIGFDKILHEEKFGLHEKCKGHLSCLRLFLNNYDHAATYLLRDGVRNGAISIGQRGGSIMKKAPSDSPIWQLKKMELLLPLSLLITKPLKLDLSNLHYWPHYKPHYRTQGCVIIENNITTPLQTPLRTPLRIL